MSTARSLQPRLLVVTLLVAGCATPALPLPAELEPAERLDVQGMKRLGTPQELRIGSYRATAIDRSWTRGDGWSIGGLTQNRARQTYEFRFLEGDMDRGHVACEITAERRSVDLRVLEIDPGANIALACAGSPGSDTADLLLTLSTSGDRHLEGRLTDGSRRLQVRAVGRGGTLTPAETHGFHLLDDGRVVAAVQTNTDGTLWISPGLDAEGRRMAVLAAVALLLYEEPSTD